MESYRVGLGLGAAAVALCSWAQAVAATVTWDGGSGTDDRWDRAGNWTIAGTPPAGDDLVFATAFTSGTSIDLNGNRTVNSLTINAPTAFSLDNNTLTITAGAINRSAVSGTTTINSAVLFGAASAVSTISGNLIVNGTLSISGGAITTTFDVSSGGNLTLSAIAPGGGGSDVIAFRGAGNTIVNGAISDSGGGSTASVSKTGSGSVTFSVGNTYASTTTVGGGVLRLNNATSLPGRIGSSGGTANLSIGGGGVVGLGDGNFQRPLGTGTTGVQFTGSGGFAAFTADRSVNLGGASASVTWAGGSFVPNGSALILGSSGADKTVTFANPVNLNGAGRTIQVENGSAAIDAILSGALSNGGLNKTGAGTLSLSIANTYTGGTTLTAGTLQLGVDNALGTGGLNFAGGTLNANNRNDSTIGALSLSASSVLNLSAGGSAGSLTFDSAAWAGGTLTINGWTAPSGFNGYMAGTDDRIFSTANPGALLAHIQFAGYPLGAHWISGGEIVPVPEPVNLALGTFGAGALGLGIYRRVQRRGNLTPAKVV